MVFVQGDWGGSGPSFKGRNRGKNEKHPRNNGGTIPAPKQRAPTPAPYIPPAPVYQAPVYNPPPAPVYNPPAPVYNPPSGGGGGFNGGGGGGGGGYNPPPPPPKLSKKDWLAGDDIFQGQKADYKKELADFLSRIAVKEDEFKADYETAMAGLDRNEESGLEALGQDFTNRGLAYSGMFFGEGGAQDEAQAGYGRQRKNMTTSKDRAESDFDSQKDDKERSIGLAKKNARLSALDRMAMDQMF